MLFFADVTPPADSDWIKQAIVWSGLFISMAAGLGGLYFGLRRQPSVDVDVTKLQEKHEALKAAYSAQRERQDGFEERILDEIKDIKGRLETGNGVHSGFSSQLAAQGQKVTDLTQQISELSGRVTFMPEHIVDLLKVFVKPK